MENLSPIEISTMKHYRYHLYGSCMTEDLWNALIGDLDRLRAEYVKELEYYDTRSMLDANDKELGILQTKIAVLERIINVKLEMQAEAERQKLLAEERKKIEEAIAIKTRNELVELDVSELHKMLNELK